MHLRVVVACHAQYVHHFAHRAIGAFGPVHYLHHGFVAGLSVLEQFLRDKYVGSQEFTVGDKQSIIVLHLEGAYKHLLLGLEYLEHLCLGFAVGALGANVYLHLVAVERVLGVAFGHKYHLAATRVEHHAVFTVAATHKCAGAHHIAVGELKLAGGGLLEHAFKGEFLYYLHHQSACQRTVGAYCRRYLLIIVGDGLLIIEEFYHFALHCRFLEQQV